MWSQPEVEEPDPLELGPKLEQPPAKAARLSEGMAPGVGEEFADIDYVQLPDHGSPLRRTQATRARESYSPYESGAAQSVTAASDSCQRQLHLG